MDWQQSHIFSPTNLEIIVHISQWPHLRVQFPISKRMAWIFSHNLLCLLCYLQLMLAIYLSFCSRLPKFEAAIGFDLSMYQVDSVFCLMIAQQMLNDDSPEMPTLLVKFSSTSSLAINTFISSWSDGMWVWYSAKRC